MADWQWFALLLQARQKRNRKNSCTKRFPMKSFVTYEYLAFSNFTLFTSLSLTHTHTHTFNAPFSGTTQVSRYQKGKTNLDFTEWQWRQLGHMQVCTLLQTDNHASTPPLSFLQAGCPSCRPSNSVKALKAIHISQWHKNSTTTTTPETDQLSTRHTSRDAVGCLIHRCWSALSKTYHRTRWRSSSC